MNLLVLGGTQFVGRHIVETARGRGHRITIFHRGRTNPDLFPDVESVTGDRNSQLERLAGRAWDAVIKTNSSASLLKTAPVGVSCGSIRGTRRTRFLGRGSEKKHYRIAVVVAITRFPGRHFGPMATPEPP